MNKEQTINDILDYMEEIEDDKRSIGFAEWYRLKRYIKRMRK